MTTMDEAENPAEEERPQVVLNGAHQPNDEAPSGPRSRRPFRVGIGIGVTILLLAGAFAAGRFTSDAARLRSDLRFANKTVGNLQAQNKSQDENLARLEGEKGDLQTQNASLQQQLGDTQAELTKLKARAPLPNFSGQDKADVESLASDHGWKVVVKQQVSSSTPGTVIAQSPKPGTTMRSGATFTIVLAKKAPPGWKDVKVWSGHGSLNTEEFTLSPDFNYKVTYVFSGSTNAIIVLKERPDEYVELVINEIGNYSSSSRLYQDGTFYFNIEGGSWTVHLQVYK